jgi:hypothetical protein
MKLIELTKDGVDAVVEVGSRAHEKFAALGFEAKPPAKEKSAEPAAFADMSVAELKAVAAEHAIDLGTATKKADIVAVLEDAAAQK